MPCGVGCQSLRYWWERVRFAEVLPYIAAAIHHGGAGTTHALVTHGIPQIVVPKAADQARQASGVARSGVGYHIPPKQLTVSLAVEALQKILADDAPARLNAASLQKEFASLGGVPKGRANISCSRLVRPAFNRSHS